MTITRNVLPPSVTRLKTFISPWQPDTTTRGNIIVVVAFFLPENAKAWSNSKLIHLSCLRIINGARIDRSWSRSEMKSIEVSVHTLDSIVDIVGNYVSYHKCSSNRLNCDRSWPFIGAVRVIKPDLYLSPHHKYVPRPILLPYGCLRMKWKWNVWNSNRLAQ